MCNPSALLAACLLATTPMASAGPDEDRLLLQVKQVASKGQNAQTTAQVNQYVDANHDEIAAILKGYMDYLKQIQSMAADDESGPAPKTQAAPAGGAQTAAPQAATVLRIAAIQPSGSLKMAHLAGYPALPEVEPVSSLTQPTAAQLAHGAEVQKEMQARKAYLMANPQGYSY